MSAIPTKVKKKKDKLLIRIRPGISTKQYGYLSHVMKAGEWWKCTTHQAKLLRQNTCAEGDIFEVASIQEALRKAREETKDASVILEAPPVPEFIDSIEDEGARRARSERLRKENSYTALLQEARDSDLLLSAEDEAFLKQAVDRGAEIYEGSTENHMNARLDILETMIRQILNAKEIQNQNLRPQPGAKPPHFPDLYEEDANEDEEEAPVNFAGADDVYESDDEIFEGDDDADTLEARRLLRDQAQSTAERLKAELNRAELQRQQHFLVKHQEQKALEEATKGLVKVGDPSAEKTGKKAGKKTGKKKSGKKTSRGVPRLGQNG